MVESKGGGKGGKGASLSASKSYLARVLLHDNVSQQQLLDMKLSQISIQQKRVTRMWDNHKKTFVYKQFQKQQQFRDAAVDPNLIRLIPPSVQKEHGLTLPPIEGVMPSEGAMTPAPEVTTAEGPVGDLEPVLITEDPNALGNNNNSNNNNVSLLSLDDPPPVPKTPKVDSSAESPVDGGAVQVVVAVKQKNGKSGAAAVELPPIKKTNTFYDDEVVNDQRFSNLFESLTGNFFTDAFGRHPLIA